MPHCRHNKKVQADFPSHRSLVGIGEWEDQPAPVLCAGTAARALLAITTIRCRLASAPRALQAGEEASQPPPPGPCRPVKVQDSPSTSSRVLCSTFIALQGCGTRDQPALVCVLAAGCYVTLSGRCCSRVCVPPQTIRCRLVPGSGRCRPVKVQDSPSTSSRVLCSTFIALQGCGTGDQPALVCVLAAGCHFTLSGRCCSRVCVPPQTHRSRSPLCHTPHCSCSCTAFLQPPPSPPTPLHRVDCALLA
jgi:hypothetical protein